MTTDETYEIERLKIQLSQTDDIILYKPCWSFKNEDLYITVNCEEINFQGNGYIKNVLRSNVQTKTVKLTVKCTAISANYKHLFLK